MEQSMLSRTKRIMGKVKSVLKGISNPVMMAVFALAVIAVGSSAPEAKEMDMKVTNGKNGFRPSTCPFQDEG
jgi:hypothetical protein